MPYDVRVLLLLTHLQRVEEKHTYCNNRTSICRVYTYTHRILCALLCGDTKRRKSPHLSFLLSSRLDTTAL